ncbi:MAG: M48 family metallopeptidase [Deltaproteobacteria bacterium]|nr:M48 family metallopeptidase [Deltaproteobacteria bacterium]
MPEVQFASRLQEQVTFPLRVRFTWNRSTMLSVRKLAGGVRELRIQHGFRAGGDVLARAVASYVQNQDEKSSRTIDGFLRENQEMFRRLAGEAATRPVEGKGRHHDLCALLERVVQMHRLDVPDVRIGWGIRRSTRRARRSIRFGSFSPDNTVKIHPDLDHPRVPSYFVEYVIYHELLHAVAPARQGPGLRRQVHTARFNRLERKFYCYEKARAFEEQFIKTMLG